MPDQRSLGLKSDRLATVEQARPVPVFGGFARLGATFLCEPFGVNTSSVGLKNGAYVFASWAALYARGPVDMIDKIMWDDKTVWGAAGIERGVAAYEDITIDFYGTVRFYWGTEAQVAEPKLAGHPAYRGQAYMFFDNVRIGVDRYSLPNIEIIMARWPRPTWFTPTANLDRDCNAAAWLAERLQDGIDGLGMADARLDTDSFNAAGAVLEAEDLGVSPVLTRQQGIRQVVADLFSYVDGYLTASADGKIGMGLAREGSPVLTVDETKLTAPPQVNPTAWNEVTTKTTLSYSDRVYDLNGETVIYNDRGAFQTTGINRDQTAQRPWLTRTNVAWRVAMAAGLRAATPGATGKLRVRRSVGEQLPAGTLFSLDYDDLAAAGVLLRVTEQALPAPDGNLVAEIKFEVDQSHLNVDDAPGVVASAPPDVAESPIDPDQLVIELPWMRAFSEPQLLLLASRTLRSVVAMAPHRELPSGSFEQQTVVTGFAVRGEVAANYPVTTTVDRALGVTVTVDSLDTDIANVAFADALVGDVFAVIEDEICGVFGADLIGANLYRLYLIRGRFDTVAASHAKDKEVFIFRRAEMATMAAENRLASQGVKLQQIGREGAEDLGGVDLLTTTTTNRWWRPLEPRNLAAFGDRANPTYATGADVTLTWSVTSERRLGMWDGWAEGGWIEALPETVLEFWVAGVLKQTVEIATGGVALELETVVAGMGNYTLLHADLVAWLGSEVSFEVRAYHRRNGLRSYRYARLLVTKI